MRIFLLLLSLLLAAAPATGQEEKYHRVYGNCWTSTDVDLFTDIETHTVACGRASPTNPDLLTSSLMISMASVHEPSIMLHSGGDQFLTDEHVPVAIRIDKRPPILRDAEKSSEPEYARAGIAHIFDEELARTLLYHIASGQQIAIKVGTEHAIIPLDGARHAIADFRRRAGLPLPPQNLSIPPQQTSTPKQR